MINCIKLKILVKCLQQLVIIPLSCLSLDGVDAIIVIVCKLLSINDYSMKFFSFCVLQSDAGLSVPLEAPSLDARAQQDLESLRVTWPKQVRYAA